MNQMHNVRKRGNTGQAKKRAIELDLTHLNSTNGFCFHADSSSGKLGLLDQWDRIICITYACYSSVWIGMRRFLELFRGIQASERTGNTFVLRSFRRQKTRSVIGVRVRILMGFLLAVSNVAPIG
jgi:hypothetical protein